LTAVRLARGSPAPLVVLLAGADRGTVDRLEEACTAWLEAAGASAEMEKHCVTGSKQLINVARRRRARLLLISRDSRLFDQIGFEKLVDDAPCPVGLVQ
jgi:hypothetical protein